ncbi:hypothetical protein ON010_g18197 [Phytophthora cinnamomi]|nr:hypothetical protein ON010_g18197 [Phytophthora cinnamomi]
MVDVQPEEILQALAKPKTRDARRAMSYLHGDEFVDTQTLLTFPTSSEHKKPSYSYRAIKWTLLKAKRREGQKSLDFCYLEYAGKRKAHAGASSVVRHPARTARAHGHFDHQDPPVQHLEGHGHRADRRGHGARGREDDHGGDHGGLRGGGAPRQGLVGEAEDGEAAVPGRVGVGLHQGAQGLRGVSARILLPSEAPLRHVRGGRVLQLRAAARARWAAGRTHDRDASVLGVDDGMLETTTSTTNVGTETYVGGLRYPKHRGLRRGGVEESLRGSSSQATPVRSPIPSFRQRHRPLSSHNSVQGNGYDYDEEGSDQFPRAASESARRDRRSSALRHSTLSSSGSMSAQAKKEALGKLIEHVRQIRDTINVAISEAEEEEERHSMLLESGRGDPDAGAERYDDIYDRIMKIRETLDVSSSDFDAVLESIGHNDLMRPSDTVSDRRDSDLAFSLSEGTGSEHRSAYESESLEFLSSRSSLLSGSVQSLDHQDAGEPLPSPRPEDESAIEEARALEEAMHTHGFGACKD